MNPSKIPDHIREAYQLLQDGVIQKSEWYGICEGKPSAIAYENALSSIPGGPPGPPPDEPGYPSDPDWPPPPPEEDEDEDEGWDSDEDEGWDSDEDEGWDSPDDSPSPDVMPPVLALTITFVIGVMYYLTGELELLGVGLFAISFGFHFVGLLWLEILTMSRFSNRSDMAWEFRWWARLILISVAASITIIVTNHIPGIEGPFGMMFTENMNQYSLLEIGLIIQVWFNILLVISMRTTNSGQPRFDVSKKFLRSPWTVGSAASLLTCWFMVEYSNHPWEGDLVMMLLGAVIVGSSAWIYGRSQVSEWQDILFYTSVPTIIGLVILQFSDETGQIGTANEKWTLISFIFWPLIVNGISWIAPTRISDDKPQDLDDTRMGVIGSNVVILCAVTVAMVMFSYHSDTGIIPLVPLAFVYHIYSREHSRKMGGDVLKVHRILPRDPSNIKEFKKVGLKFSLLGPSGSGKTSFATALWTLMREPENMQIWWSKQVDSRGEHKILGPGKNTDRQTLEALAARGKATVESMMDSRISGETCRKFWEGNGNDIQPGSLPEPGSKIPFPFFAEAFQSSQKILDKHKGFVVEPNPLKRKFPPPTQFGKKVEMNISFLADVEVISPSFLFTKSPLSRSRTGLKSEVELTMVTWDIVGENFTAAVNHTREQVHKYGTSRPKKLREDINPKWIQDNHPAAQIIQVQEARTLFLDNSHSFLLVDIEDLLDGDRAGVKEYLRLMQIINRDRTSNLESLFILLNKADNLLDVATETPLEYWEDMNDDTKAEYLLNRSTNYALDQLRGTGMQVNVKFVCAFGGLAPVMKGPKNKRVPVMDGGHPKTVPPYPLIPVNVIEPLIEVILTSRLHSEDN